MYSLPYLVDYLVIYSSKSMNSSITSHIISKYNKTQGIRQILTENTKVIHYIIVLFFLNRLQTLEALTIKKQLSIDKMSFNLKIKINVFNHLKHDKT